MIIAEPLLNAGTTKKRLNDNVAGVTDRGFWLALAVYCFWYFFLAKTV